VYQAHRSNGADLAKELDKALSLGGAYVSEPSVLKKAIPVEPKPTTAKEFNTALRKLVNTYADQLLTQDGLDEFTFKQAKEKFIVWVEEDIHELSRLVNKLRADAKDKKLIRIGEHTFNEAALVLGITVRWRESINLKTLRRVYKQRIAEVHVDRPGNEGNGDEMKELTEAYEILVSYMESVFPLRGKKEKKNG
jgi:hypothetical protein